MTSYFKTNNGHLIAKEPPNFSCNFLKFDILFILFEQCKFTWNGKDKLLKQYHIIKDFESQTWEQGKKKR